MPSFICSMHYGYGVTAEHGGSMATRPRERSESGFYHVFQRGVSLFDIFEDDEDREFYLNRLKRYAAEFDVDIHAWCLMSNHTHLLLKSDFDALSSMMRKLGACYARRFNFRHKRSGPLFEGRFGSKPINTDIQFLSVVRYIHRNPVFHEESAALGDYPWSSYGEYVTAAPQICKLALALELTGSVEQFIRFHEGFDDFERHLDIGMCGRMSDDEARIRADRALANAGFDVSAMHIGLLPQKLRNKAIVHVKKIVGCSLRQLQRLTAIAYSAIRLAVLESYNIHDCDEEIDGKSRSRVSELIASIDDYAGIPKGAIMTGIVKTPS